MYKIILVASLAATGCATPPVTRWVSPPVALLQDCPAPTSGVSTNAELAKYALELKHAIAECNLDKSALREWAKQGNR